MEIISADERLRERRGAKLLLLGPSGIRKTWQVRTLDCASTLFVDSEAGDLSVLEVPVPTIRVDDWQTARNLACRIGGPNTSFPPTACYSPAHYEAVGGPLENLNQYETIFIDSLTAITRLSFRWAEQQPEAYSERTGKKDLRGIYGTHGREMVLFLNQLQHARAKHVIFVGILERVVDEFNRAEWQLQSEGSKPRGSCPASSTRSSVISFWILATASRQRAGSCARRRILGAIQLKIAAVASSRSSNRISEKNSSASSRSKPWRTNNV
jgi:AAA domain